MQIAQPRPPMGQLWNSIQSWLFPILEDEIGALDERHRQFVAVCELCAPQDHMAAYRWCGNGCPPRDRLALCKAFIAKAVWDFATTRDLIDAIRHRPALRRLCGWESLGEVPSEATFSRAFDAFARDGRPQKIHEALIETHYGLYVPTYAPFPARQGRQGPPGSVPPSARRTAHRSAGSHPAPPLPDLRHRPYVTTEIERLARRRGKPPLHAASCPDAPPRRPRSRYSTPCSRDTTPPSRACATYAATNCAFSSRKRR